MVLNFCSIWKIWHNFLVPKQGRIQDLNLTKQKYEVLTGHVRIVAKNVEKWLFTNQKLYKMTAYQEKTLQNDCLPRKNFIKGLLYQLKTLQNDCLPRKNFIKGLCTN